MFRFFFAGLPLLLLIIPASCSFSHLNASKGIIYESPMDTPESVKGWIMEGPAKVEFRDGWMEMYSPNKKMHHVFWCPVDLPDHFVAEWEARNVDFEGEGLCMIIFAAKGLNGEDIFDPSLPKRNGGFNEYTQGAINSYHISYYADNKYSPDRQSTNLRKNKGSAMKAKGPIAIPAKSDKIYRLRLVKDGSHILFAVDGKTLIDWTDDGPAYKDGKIGFRQMQWTHFAYRNLTVKSLD